VETARRLRVLVVVCGVVAAFIALFRASQRAQNNVRWRVDATGLRQGRSRTLDPRESTNS